MDRAVHGAYGWTDVAVPPYCPKTAADREALQAFEDEVIDRLYVLNADRAREEQRLGLAGKRPRAAAAEDGDAGEAGETGQAGEAAAKKPTARGRKPGKGKKGPGGQKEMF